MIRVKVTSDGFDDLLDYVDRVSEGLRDLTPLAHKVADLIAHDNMVARMAGVDKDNEPLAEIKDVTYELHEAFRGRPRGPGGPLVPEDFASRAISGFTTEVDVLGNVAFVYGGWPDAPWLKYHFTGYTSRWGRAVPARDIGGLREIGWDRIAGEVDVFVDSAAAGIPYVYTPGGE